MSWSRLQQVGQLNRDARLTPGQRATTYHHRSPCLAILDERDSFIYGTVSLHLPGG